ncbi:hypothetical protein RHMOL_Rhmol04G0303300 [Rhododendron molle]|uniref:Uncharacterized protein n=1 Tax=Rhododendron molle TaxID=49168 RepID=A0ACC0P8F6_RHOML|nr:hypothetical protein RHMOL_Rhmol04G0303300 [Rhododendron molle]
MHWKEFFSIKIRQFHNHWYFMSNVFLMTMLIIRMMATYGAKLQIWLIGPSLLSMMKTPNTRGLHWEN